MTNLALMGLPNMQYIMALHVMTYNVAPQILNLTLTIISNSQYKIIRLLSNLFTEQPALLSRLHTYTLFPTWCLSLSLTAWAIAVSPGSSTERLWGGWIHAPQASNVYWWLEIAWGGSPSHCCWGQTLWQSPVHGFRSSQYSGRLVVWH